MSEERHYCAIDDCTVAFWVGKEATHGQFVAAVAEHYAHCHPDYQPVIDPSQPTKQFRRRAKLGTSRVGPRMHPSDPVTLRTVHGQLGH